MAKVGVEVNGIARLEHIAIAADRQLQSPADDMQEFKPLMHVGPAVRVRGLLKLSQEGMEFAIARAKIQAGQIVALVCGETAVGSPFAVFLLGDGNDAAAVLVLEEVV